MTLSNLKKRIVLTELSAN